MQASLEFSLQRSVNSPRTGNTRLAGEKIRNHQQPVVRFSARRCARPMRVTGVLSTLILYFELVRTEFLHKNGSDSIVSGVHNRYALVRFELPTDEMRAH